ncbi:hypothetical protein KJ640_00465 [bacterium]|nr:hypothetical protein [bacterium]
MYKIADPVTASLTIDEIAFVALKVELKKEYNITSSQVFYLKKHPDVVKLLASRANAILENIFQLSTIIEVIGHPLAPPITRLS